ncbi:MAG TPA: hypothetical protein DCY15_00050 [Ruminococcaceae bacterium]|nr:hypothetical protein [Oscillospiraceae bacterium]
MKRVISLTLIALMGLFMLTSCGTTANDEANASTIIANYSIKNSEDDKSFIVEVQQLGGVYDDLYDKDGLYVRFVGGKDKIYDADGKELTRADLAIGATLEISYDGKLAKNSPKTIKAYKVTVIG